MIQLLFGSVVVLLSAFLAWSRHENQGLMPLGSNDVTKLEFSVLNEISGRKLSS